MGIIELFFYLKDVGKIHAHEIVGLQSDYDGLNLAKKLCSK